MNNDLQLDIWSHIETPTPVQRLVLLGASNLSRAFPIAVSMSQRVFNVPLDIYVAKGHGRSYGKESSCLGKKNSGIFSCGIWRELEQDNSMPTSAFITDIGNDLAYEQPVEVIIEWVSACLDRLLDVRAQVVLGDLPLEALRRLSRTRYRVLRSIFFPQCRLDLEELLRRADQLSKRLNEVAKSREVPVFTVPNEWIGLDPIHPRRRHHAQLWAQMLSLVAPLPSDLSLRRCPCSLACYLRGLQPEARTFFSLLQRASQPQGRLCEGTRIFLY